jgi:hypothetical protein
LESDMGRCMWLGWAAPAVVAMASVAVNAYQDTGVTPFAPWPPLRARANPDSISSAVSCSQPRTSIVSLRLNKITLERGHTTTTHRPPQHPSAVPQLVWRHHRLLATQQEKSRRGRFLLPCCSAERFVANDDSGVLSASFRASRFEGNHHQPLLANNGTHEGGQAARDRACENTFLGAALLSCFWAGQSLRARALLCASRCDTGESVLKPCHTKRWSLPSFT